MKTISVKIKAPPKGWKYEPRLPRKMEDCMWFSSGQWLMGCRGERETVANIRGEIFAFRQKKGSKP